MAKRSLDNHIIEKKPSGPVTVADNPHRVKARIRWTLDMRYTTVDAFAIAWTKTEVCIYFFTTGMPNPAVVWLPADDVRR